MCRMCICFALRCPTCGFILFFFFNDTATTEIYTRSIVGSVRCVQETGVNSLPQWTLGESFLLQGSCGCGAYSKITRHFPDLAAACFMSSFALS
eukprot:TRINITY_DN52895_c0_g1_i2.p1 TRINITY_DN52895_c0_g1~~TRINITY_DN52895_c0_g1_i2.p1  ORF type:complete len:109 (+),score=12.39 TRINITY_DN52895_c0_g1_i2:46-327(+)